MVRIAFENFTMVTIIQVHLNGTDSIASNVLHITLFVIQMIQPNGSNTTDPVVVEVLVVPTASVVLS